MSTSSSALDRLELKSAIVRNPLVVSTDTTVRDAIAQMSAVRAASTIGYRESREHLMDDQLDELHLEVRSSCVVVVENEQVLGIVTQQDVVLLIAQQQDLDRKQVRQVMTRTMCTLRESAFRDLFLAIDLLQQHQIRHLPILDEQDRLVGMITQTSLLQAFNPLKLYEQAQVLAEKVLCLEAEKLASQESRTVELEREIEARTAALQTKAEREKLVATIANRIRNSLNLEEILDVCVAEVRAFLECDRVLVYQFQPDWSGIIIAESVGEGWSDALGNQIQDCCFGQQIATRYNCEQPIVVNNIYTAGYSDCHIQLLEHYQIKANLVVPIRVAGQLWGLLIGNQCGEYRNWQQDDVTLLQDISVQLAIAIQQATTHQKLQQELNERRRGELRYASLAEAALVGIFRADEKGNCIYFNNRYFEITGLTRETAFGNEWQKALHPEDRDRVMAECYQSVQENRPFQLEYRFIRPDGTVTWVYGQSVPERDTDGLIIGHAGNIIDITAQKRSVEALQRSEAHHRALISAIPDLIARINRAGIYLEFVASPKFHVVGNLTELVGSHVFETLPPEVAQKRMEYIELALQTNTIQSYQQDLTIDGRMQIEEVRIVPYSEDEVLALVRDITDRRRTENALEASQRTLLNLISNLPGYVYRVHNDRNYTAEFISSGVEDITGYHPDEYLIERSISCGQEIHPDDANVVWEIVQTAVALRQPYECEYRIITKTGEEKWVWERGQGIYSQNDELLILEGFVTDITDRQRAETALKKAENQYREAQRLAHLGNWEYDIAKNTCYWSDEVFRIFGIERQTFAPSYQAFLNLIHPDDRSMVKEAYTRHLHDGTPYKIVHRCLMPDGQIKYLQDECETIYAADGTPILSQGTVQDITSQKLAQLELECLNAKLETIVAERTQKLWQVNNLQRAILNSSDYAIVSTDLNGTIQTFNAGAQRMLGYRAKEVVGKLNPSVFHDREEMSQQAAVLSVELGQNISPDLEVVVAKARQGIVSEAEWTLIRKDGSRLDALLSVTALKNAHQKIIGFLGIAKDISEQKQSEIERQQLLQELSALKIALDESAIVSIINTQGAIQYVNDHFCELVGYSREQLIGQNHTIIYSDYHSPSYIQELWDTITGGEIWRGEICYQAQNGSLYWFVSTIVPFLNELGQPFQYLGIHFDITVRKLVKAKLKQENSFRQQIMENMAEGLCVCHDIAEFPFVRFTVWNPQMLAITGYSLEEINCLGWYQILYPDSEMQAQAIARMERMRQGDRLIAEEWEIQRQDGHKRTIAISTSALLSNDGQTHILALIQDITDRKAAEKLLQDREARYHGLMEAASDAIILTDEQGNLLEVNRKAEELLGYTAAELTSMHFTKLHRLEELPRIVTAFEELTDRKSCQVFDVNFRCKDGHLVPTDVSASLIEIQEEKIIQYIFRDITDRKRAEAALRESETRFRRVFESNIVGMIFTDFSGAITEANDRFLEMLGYTREDLKANLVNWAAMTPPEYHQLDLEVIEDLKRHRVRVPWEKVYYHKDGHSVPVIIGAALLDEDSDSCVALVLDISDRKRAEAALQKSETRFRRVFESNIVGMIFTNFSGVITEANDRFLEMLGYTREDLKAHLVNWATMTPPEYHQLDIEQMEKLWRDRVLTPVEKAYYHKDGHQVPVLIGAALLTPEDNGSCVCLVLDISDRKHTENALRESQQFLQTVLDSFPQSVFWKDRNSVYLGCNQLFAQTLGLPSPLEVVGFTDIDFSLTEAEIRSVRADDRQVIESGLAKLGIEEVITLPTGEQQWLETNKIPLRDLAGNVIGVVGTFQDITDRKDAEKALRESQQFIQTVIDTIPLPLFWKNRESVFLGCNLQFAKTLGLSSTTEIVGKTDFDLLLTESQIFSYRASDRQVMESGQSKLGIEETLSLPNGEQRWLETHKAPLRDWANHVIGVVGMFQDITTRKQNEEKLLDFSNRLTLALKAGAIGTWDWDMIHEASWDDRMYEIYGLQDLGRPVIYQDWIDRLHPNDREKTKTAFQAAVLGEADFNEEFRIWRTDGALRWIKAVALLERNTQGLPLRMTGINYDITDRLQAEQRMRQQAVREALLREITQRIRQSLDLQTIFETATLEIRQFLQADRVSIFQFYPDSGFDDGEFVSESVAPGFMSVLNVRIHDHCFGEQFAHLYQQGRFQATDDVDNADLEDCHRAVLSQFQIRANLILPLLKKDELWGLLCIHQCSSPRQWQLTEISFTQEIANQLTLAIHQASLYEQMQSELAIRKQTEVAIALQLQRQRTLTEITQQIRESLNLQDILALVTQQVKDLMNSDRVIVFRLFPDGKSQIVAEAVSSEFFPLKNLHWDNETWSQEILESYWKGKPRIVPDVMKDLWTNCLVEYSLEGQIKSKIVAPILQEIRSSENHRWVAPQENNKLWGILVVHACREKRVWQESEAQILQQIANQLAIAIQQANFFEQLQQELSERQLAQQQLVETNQQLAISYQELARATRLKDEFLANMSHELRTPLNAILGMTEGLQDQIFGSVNEQQIKALKTVESSGSHLLELINDILDVAKIESGQLELDCIPTSIALLCQSSLTFIKQQALKKRILLETKLPLNLPDILVDERRIRQVLINLLNNAVKFTPEGGHITLAVSWKKASTDSHSTTSPPQNYLRISITDTGIGIACEDMKKLFQPFVQIDSALNRQYAGTGLGLTLVKRLVELHGGQVGVTSEPGVGSCFMIDLPCAASEFSAAKPEMSSEAGIELNLIEPEASPLILLAEDNEANINTVSHYLRATGYRIVVARNGQEAIACVESENPDLILMDIQMPGIDGLEAMRQIRSHPNPNLANVPIVALTALAMTDDRDRCLAAGANDYLTKPVKLKLLVITIQKILLSQDR